MAVYRAMRVLGHACAEEVAGEVRKTTPTTTVGTIYNALDCLVEHGLLAKIQTTDNKMYFDINTREHYHLYCEKTHRIEDFEDEGLARIIRAYLARNSVPGFRVTGTRLQLTGTFEK